MPQVPVYGGNKVQEQALRPVYQRAPDVSSGLQQVARGVGQVADAMDAKARRDAEIEVNDIDARLTAGWLEWDAQARRQYQGQNVGEYEAKAKEWWEKARGEYAPTASPLAQQALGQVLGRKRNQALGSVLGHVNAEKDRFADQQAEAAAQTTIEFGIDTGDTAGAGARVRAIAAEKGARKGWTTEMVQAEQQRLLGTMHLAYITRLAENNPEQATAYFEANKAEIPATAQVKVEQVLKGERDNQFATQFAAKHATLPLSEQLAKAAEITDPERREKALQQIRNNHAMVEQAKREREGAASDQAWQLASQGKRVPETVLMQMNGRERAQLKDWLREKSKQAAAGTPVKTDWGVYQEVRERIVAGEKVNMAPYSLKIAPSEMEKLIDLQTQAGTAGKQDSMLTDAQRLDQALTGLGIDKKREPEAAGLLAAEIDRRVRAESAAKGGKDLTADEKQKVIDAVVMDQVYVDEWGSDPRKPLALLTPEELSKAYVNVGGRDVKVSTVPMADRRQIIAALRQVGRVPTEQSIVEMYLKAQGQKAPAAQ